jgi:hypothetical protein
MTVAATVFGRSNRGRASMRSRDGTAALTPAILALDYLRRSPSPAGGEGSHKEWLHFVVHAPGVEALVNFSLVDDVRPEAGTRAELARLVVLVKTDEWCGDVELFDPGEVTVTGGAIDMRYGTSSVRFERDAFQIHVRLRDRPVSIDLVLRPDAAPIPCHNIRFEIDQRPINWMVLPRLAAYGEIRVRGKTFRLDRAAAYHDHNWGHFSWGRDFAWEWGYALPEDLDGPWSVVYVRLSDRRRLRTYKQAVFLWHRAAAVRVFRDTDVQVTLAGLLRPRRVFKLPAIMNVLNPGTAVDVPLELRCRAGDRTDELSLAFRADEVAQVCIPNDTDDIGITVINEVSGRLCLEGAVGGECVRIDGPAMFEFIRGA